MKHRDRTPEQDDLLRPRLVDMIDMRHELVKLAALIDWDWFERDWAGFFPSKEGRPATHPRLVAGLMYLQHVHRLSDDAVVARWVENPYFQHFTHCPAGHVSHAREGRDVLSASSPDPPVLAQPLSANVNIRLPGSGWRDRIGEEGAEWLLTKTIEAGRAAGAVDDTSLKRVAVDTTVMEKNIAHPTDARLYEKARAKLVDLAREGGLRLRQSYARKAPRLAAQIGRHAHARQFKRMRKALRTLKGYTGRVLRDIRRQLGSIPAGEYPLAGRACLHAREARAGPRHLVLVSRLLHQTPKSRGKLYALHEPEVDCIR